MTKSGRSLIAGRDSKCAWCAEMVWEGDPYEVLRGAGFVHPVCLDAAVKTRREGPSN